MIRLLSAVVIALMCAACQPLDTTQDRGPLRFERTPGGFDSIPLAYGNLISVAPIPDQPYNQMMWFVQPDQTIVGVRVNVALGTLPLVIKIPRR